MLWAMAEPFYFMAYPMGIPKKKVEANCQNYFLLNVLKNTVLRHYSQQKQDTTQLVSKFCPIKNMDGNSWHMSPTFKCVTSQQSQFHYHLGEKRWKEGDNNK
jgi:hypothetical protein